MGVVLNIQYPAFVTTIMDAVRFLSNELLSLSNFVHMDCLLGHNFYRNWSIKVLATPSFLLFLVLVYHSVGMCRLSNVTKKQVTAVTNWAASASGKIKQKARFLSASP